VDVRYLTVAPASAVGWDCDIREYAGKPTVAKSARRFSGCSTATIPEGSPRQIAEVVVFVLNDRNAARLVIGDAVRMGFEPPVSE
jgi:hypothetical protein